MIIEVSFGLSSFLLFEHITYRLIDIHCTFALLLIVHIIPVVIVAIVVAGVGVGGC